METINLGAVLFALLILLWLVYAVPRIAERRDLMGQTRAVDLSRDSSTIRDLSGAVRNRRRPLEVTSAMSTSRLLSRPADPTQRPRFEEPERVELPEEPQPVDLAARTRAVLRVALVGLVALALLLGALALFGPVPFAAPIIAAVLAGLLAGLLVRSEAVARERARRESRESGRHVREQAPTVTEPEDAERMDLGDRVRRTPETVSREAETERIALPELPSLPLDGAVAREWTPRPVPRPAYSLRGDVEDLATRHDAHRRAVLETSMPYEREDVEEVEARIEQVENLAPAVDLDLDAVLARRRGA